MSSSSQERDLECSSLTRPGHETGLRDSDSPFRTRRYVGRRLLIRLLIICGLRRRSTQQELAPRTRVKGERRTRKAESFAARSDIDQHLDLGSSERRPHLCHLEPCSSCTFVVCEGQVCEELRVTDYRAVRAEKSRPLKRCCTMTKKRCEGRRKLSRSKSAQVAHSRRLHADVRISIPSLMCCPLPLVRISMSGTGIPCVYCE